MKSVEDYLYNTYKENALKTKRQYPNARIDSFEDILLAFKDTKPEDTVIFTYYLGRSHKGQLGNHDYTVDQLCWLRKVNDTPDVLDIAKEHGFDSIKDFRRAIIRQKNKYGSLDLPYRERRTFKDISKQRVGHSFGKFIVEDVHFGGRKTIYILKCKLCGRVFERIFRQKLFKSCPYCQVTPFRYRNSSYFSMKRRLWDLSLVQNMSSYFSEYSVKYRDHSFFELCFDLNRLGKLSRKKMKRLIYHE